MITYYLFDDCTVVHEDDIDEYLADNQTLHYETFDVPRDIISYIEDNR